MKSDWDVRPVVWPTKEPELPPKAEPTAAPQAPPAAAPAVEKAPVSEAESQRDLPPGIETDSTHAYVWENAAAAAAVVRTIIHRDEGGPPGGPLAGMSARQVVAALMAALGVEVGAAVVMHLVDEADALWVGGAIAEEPEAMHGTAMEALEHLRQRMVAGDYLEHGGFALARDVLERAFGANRARRLVHAEEGEGENGFNMLKNVAPEQIAPFISHEHPQTIALTLSQLAPTEASGILAQLPQRMQADVAYRIAIMESITPAVLVEIGEALEASLQDILGENQAVGGPKAVADILNLTGSSVEKNVLDQMDAQDPEAAEAVRNLMFTFADIAKLADRELQTLMHQVDQKDLAISLKAAEEELKDKALGNMSERVRTSITEQIEELGPMRLSEVEGVQLRIVQQVRQLEEQGQITIVRGDSRDAWV